MNSRENPFNIDLDDDYEDPRRSSGPKASTSVSSMGSPVNTPRHNLSKRAPISTTSASEATPSATLVSTGITPKLTRLQLQPMTPKIAEHFIDLTSDSDEETSPSPSSRLSPFPITPSRSSRRLPHASVSGNKRDTSSRPVSPNALGPPSKVRHTVPIGVPSSVTVRRGRWSPSVASMSSSISSAPRQKMAFPQPAQKQPIFRQTSTSFKSATEGDLEVDEFFGSSSLPTPNSDVEMLDVGTSQASGSRPSVQPQSTPTSTTLLSSMIWSVTPADSVSTSASSMPSKDSFLSYLFKGSYDLSVEEIAHDEHVQKQFDELHISWGVQFELARGVSEGLWTWSAVDEKLHELVGTDNQSFTKVQSVMGVQDFRVSESTAGKQLHLEHLALLENKDRGLGLMGSFHAEPNWYGGRVQQAGQVVELRGGGYKVILQPLTQTKSSRFARYLGSRRLLQIRVSDRLRLSVVNQAGLTEFLSQKFVICGRVFMPWVPKEGCVYYIETEENHERETHKWCGDHLRKTYASVLEWHNPPLLNTSQPLAKYVTRNVLGLSTSVPGLLFESNKILYIEDEVASDWTGETHNIPGSKLMTDGCGFMNREALKQLAANLGLACRPSAVQARFAGTKGLWIMHPTDDDTEPKIWIRSSQHKIKHPTPYERSLRILDVVSTGHPSSGVSLASQSIVNLWHNGIPDKVFQDLMKEGLERIVLPLTKDNLTGKLSASALWNSVFLASGAVGARVQRHEAGLGRVLGIRRREFETAVVYDDSEDKIKGGGSNGGEYTGRKTYSGEPVSLWEIILEMIQAGFHPSKSLRLHDIMERFIDLEIKKAIEGYHIPLPDGKSIEAFVIPDPTHKLKQGEVFYCSSTAMIDSVTKAMVDVPEGPAVMGRYPIRLASDIQKVNMVDVPELHEYKDVIVVNIDGLKSLMTLLSGGDFDGDTAFLIWLPELVNGFENKKLRAEPLNFLTTNFERSVESVPQFDTRIRQLSSAAGQRAFLEAQLVGFTQGKVGKYSVMHDNCIRMYGYDSKEAIRLAYMFNTILDSGKTGYILRPEVFKEDNLRFCQPPRTGNSSYVLDVLNDSSYKYKETLIAKYKAQPVSKEIDPDIAQVWLNAVRLSLDLPRDSAEAVCVVAACRQKDLLAIRKHVAAARDAWLKAIASIKGHEDRGGHYMKQSGAKRKKKEGERDIMSEAVQMFWRDVPNLIVFSHEDARMLKAACAYCGIHKDMDAPLDKLIRSDEKFAFTMAFQTLCKIKADASPHGSAPCIREIDELRNMSGPARKLIEAAEVYYH